MRALAKSKLETCCCVYHHQRDDDTSTWCSGLRQGVYVYCAFRQDGCCNLFVTRGCPGISPEHMSIVHKDAVCRFYISSQEVLKQHVSCSGFADEMSKIMSVVGAEHFIFPLLRSLSERCVNLCVFY